MMTKKDKEGLVKAIALLEASNAMMQLLFDRLYVRAGDAWQFKSSVDDIIQQSGELKEQYATVPEPEPTVGYGDEDEDPEVAGLA